MNSMLFGSGLALIIGAVSLAWYIGVIVLLVKIWAKVKHLPG
jgi:hypothetical protein